MVLCSHWNTTDGLLYSEPMFFDFTQCLVLASPHPRTLALSCCISCHTIPCHTVSYHAMSCPVPLRMHNKNRATIVDGYRQETGEDEKKRRTERQPEHDGMDVEMQMCRGVRNEEYGTLHAFLRIRWYAPSRILLPYEHMRIHHLLHNALLPLLTLDTGYWMP